MSCLANQSHEKVPAQTLENLEDQGGDVNNDQDDPVTDIHGLFVDAAKPTATTNDGMQAGITESLVDTRE